MLLEMPERETKRLYLRPIEEADAADIFAYYSLESVTRYLTFPPHQDIDQTLYVLKACYLPYLKRQEPQTWAIVLKENEKVIGHLNFHTPEEDSAQVGYVLHPTYWGKGYMKEALNELLYVGFTKLKLRRVSAYYTREHPTSGKLLDACGFKKEGILRKYMKLSDGKYHDMVLCAILKEDWREQYEKNNGSKI